MKVFLTGGTGFVGTHVLGQLLEAGHDVVALRRPGSTTRLPLKVQPKWIDGTLDADHKTALEGSEVFMHLAAHTPNPPYAPLAECSYWNVFAAQNLAEQALKVGIKDFVVAGSCFEYGEAAYRFDTLNVDTPLDAMLSYPVSKAAASVSFLGWAREKKLRLKLIRIFQTYGPGEGEKRLWPALVRAAKSGDDFNMTAGDQLRDFIRVEDVARCFVETLPMANIVPGNPLVTHAATGTPQTLLEFSQAVWSQFGATGKLKPGTVAYRQNEMMRVVSDPAAVDPAMRLE